jgi:hypothetical protein
LEKVLVCLRDADRAYITQRCVATSDDLPAVAAEEETKTGQRPYRFMSRSAKKQLQEGVTAFCQIVAKSHFAELCLDAASSCEGTSRGTEWKKARNMRPEGEEGEEKQQGGEAAIPEEYAEPPVLPSDAPPVELDPPASGEPSSDFLAVLETDDITTSLLKSAAIAYRNTEDKDEKRRLLSIVAPHLNSKQGETLFGCTHHLWEAARHYAKQYGPYGRSEPVQIHRTRTGKEVTCPHRLAMCGVVVSRCCLPMSQLEELVKAFWRQPQYCQEVEGRVLLRPGLKLKQVWDDFQAAYPDNVSLGAVSVGDKMRVIVVFLLYFPGAAWSQPLCPQIGRTAFLRRIPADLKPDSPATGNPALVDDTDGMGPAGHSEAPKRPVKKRKQTKDGTSADHGATQQLMVHHQGLPVLGSYPGNGVASTAGGMVGLGAPEAADGLENLNDHTMV